MRPLACIITILSWSLDLTTALALGNSRRAPNSETQKVITSSNGQNTGEHIGGPVSSSSSILYPHGPGRRTGFIALGDSYGAGIGTGFEGQENDCRQGLNAYPQLMYGDMVSEEGAHRNNTNTNTTTAFQFLACTGATTADVLSLQMEDINKSQPADFALLSVGGNDLGFFDVMNACIFRFYTFYSGTCETALAETQRLIDSPEFDLRMLMVLTGLLDEARWEKRPWFRVVVTGYARFFNDVTEECDDVSLGVWWAPWGGPKLRRRLRRRMNDMVLAVNEKIAQSVALANGRFAAGRVLFVDYDAAFVGHRFCEPGVQEPDYERRDTWFFLVGAPDNANVDNGNGTSILDPHSKFIDPLSCLEPAKKSGDWGELALCYMAMSKAEDPRLRLAVGNVVSNDDENPNPSWHAPTYYAKTFHPRTLGHRAIRDKIYQAWATAFFY